MRLFSAVKPSVGDLVMMRVVSMTDLCVTGELMGYGDDGDGPVTCMVRLADMIKRVRVRSVNHITKVGRDEVCVVTGEAPDGTYNASRRHVTAEEKERFVATFKRAKQAMNVAASVATARACDPVVLMDEMGWPEPAELAVSADRLTRPELVELMKAEVARRIGRATYMAVAKVDITCFEQAGIAGIQEAIRAGLRAGRDVTVNLTTSPTYLVRCENPDPELVVALVDSSIDAIRGEIARQGGDMHVSQATRLVEA